MSPWMPAKESVRLLSRGNVTVFSQTDAGQAVQEPVHTYPPEHPLLLQLSVSQCIPSAATGTVRAFLFHVLAACRVLS